MKLIILDRDGVINHDSDAFIKSLAEWIPLPGSIDAIARLSRAGWTIAVATNQSGVARGHFSLAALEAMHQRLRELVVEQGGELGFKARLVGGKRQDDDGERGKPRPPCPVAERLRRHEPAASSRNASASRSVTSG